MFNDFPKMKCSKYGMNDHVFKNCLGLQLGSVAGPHKEKPYLPYLHGVREKKATWPVDPALSELIIWDGHDQ